VWGKLIYFGIKNHHHFNSQSYNPMHKGWWMMVVFTITLPALTLEDFIEW